MEVSSSYYFEFTEFIMYIADIITLQIINKFQQEIFKSMDPNESKQGDHEEIKDKTYIKSKKKWKDLNLDENIIEALRQQNKHKPTKVQQQALEVALDSARKKFNVLIRAVNGSGKTLAFLLPIISSLQPGLKFAQDKIVRGKTQQNQIFRPQGVIIIQNFLLQSQLNQYLKNFRDYGNHNNVEKLKFEIGILNNDKHTPGDIIVCMPKSFLNRHSRGNMKLDQCKFVAIDEIDEIYNFDKDSLGQILKIVKDSRPNLIACSATMEKHFLEFYKEADPDYIRLNINADLEKETGQKVTLEGVKNYCKSIECEKDSKVQIYDYVLKVIFKQLYGGSEVNKKPQVFVFFNSVDEIDKFDKKFESLAGDFTTEQSKYLQNITRAGIAAKTYKDGQKVDLPHSQKQYIISKFRNGETNVLLCTNIMARGIDIRNAVFVINVCAPKKSDKDNDIDVDIYLHRVGRTGRYNDKGIALTLGTAEQIERLKDSVKKVHRIDIQKMDSVKQIVEEVYKCIEANA